MPFLLGWAVGLVTPLVVYLVHEAASKFVEHQSRHYCAKCLASVQLVDGTWVATEDGEPSCDPGHHRVDHHVYEED